MSSEWARHDRQWRDPAQVTAQWQEASETSPELVRHRVRGAWWDVVAEAKVTVLISREYEHLLVALGVASSGPYVTFMRLPHPSGIAVDRDRGVVSVASTRNPNQIFDLAPVAGRIARSDVPTDTDPERPLVPVRSRFLPGSLYLHDLAYIGGELHGNAVGHNAVVRLPDAGGFERVWWPKSIETVAGPDFGRNHLQLNSIAAGKDLASSSFSASAEAPSARRPGHRNFAVDHRGVIFDGRTREVSARGLTRPHSARIHDGRLWVDNSGYGELGVVRDGGFEPAIRLPGWTRGLTFHGDIAFVGTSRVIPRFSAYAPGLDVESSVCGVHAVDTRSGRLLGSLTWPAGNQIFAVDTVPAAMSSGFAFAARRRGSDRRIKRLFYTFAVDEGGTADG